MEPVAMSSKPFSLTDAQITKLRNISEASSKAYKNNLRLTQGPEATNYRELAQEYKKGKLVIELASEELVALEEERVMVEKDLEAYEASLKVSKDRLAHVTGHDARTVPVLQLEISSLEAKVNEYSDAALGLIEKIDTQSAKHVSLEHELKIVLAKALEAKEALEALKLDVANCDAKLQEEIAAAKVDLDPSLVALLARVPKQIVDKVAFVMESSCSGCRLKISASLSDKIRRFSREVHYCEECGRLLLLPQRANETVEID